jgi:tRNA-dihydrouridine synthase B
MAWLARGERPADPTLGEQYDLIVEHYDMMLSHYGTLNGVNLMRKHLGWYTKGLPGSAEFRNQVNQQDDPRRVLAMLEGFYAPYRLKAAA